MPFVRITNLSRGSIYLDLADLKLVNLPPEDREGLRTQLQSGDLLVSITADIGIIGYVDNRVPQPAYINQHIALVRYNPSVVDTKFLSYFLASEHPQRAFRMATDQGAKAGMNLTGVLRIQAAFPSLLEQHAIATALNDVDGLLGGLDRLIAKKRDLKQAAMQQLLTGQTRLPGFHGEWVVKTLGNIGKFKNGLNKESSAFGHGSPFVNLMDVFGVDSISSTSHLGLVASSKLDREVYGLRRGDVLFIRSSVKPSGVGLTAVIECDLAETVYSGFLIRFRDDGVLNVGFKKHCFSEESFRKKIIAASSVSANTNINQNALRALTLLLPTTKEEQTAIAAVLSDMDAELAALEARRDKTRDLKQAMMQELLTGKTRLISHDATCTEVKA